ncbi:MAG: sugar ABC transporter ATP-binding protein [Eubacteriales bacterium]
MGELLEMRNIFKRFGATVALDDVSIDLDYGEVVALVGENGAGKSTLMKILSGSYANGTYEGEIYIDQKPQMFKSSGDSEAAGIEMIYQEISLHLDLTVAENMFLGCYPKKFGFVVDNKKMHENAKKYLEIVGLDVSSKEMVRNLSTSQQQLLCIAKAISRKPKLLVLDEPTSALTEVDCQILIKIIKNLKAEGISSIYISHKLEEVFQVADRISVLRDGKLISTNMAKDVSTNSMIEDMVGRKISTMFPKEEVERGGVLFSAKNVTVPHPYVSHKNIVEDVSFDVHRGEILGIAGLVGSGRSELVNAIFGAIKKTDGETFMNGKKINISSPNQAIEYNIGLLTEDRKKSGIVESMTIRENMTLANLGGISKNGVIIRARENEASNAYSKRLNLKHGAMTDGITSLSGGNQQKVILAKWLMKNVELLILDEPTRGIDVGAKVEIYKIMTELAKKGMGVVMISSELPELLAMSDRIIVLGNGNINGEFDRQDFSPSEIMHAATGV